MTECQVCGSMVDNDVPAVDAEHEGETYYFESAKCKELFEENPNEYR